MTNGKSGRNKKIYVNKKKLITWIIVITIFLIMTIFKVYFNEESTEDTGNQQNTTSQTTNVDGELILTMINVGQADCFLFEQNGKVALVDCGTRSTGKDAVEYLKSQEITKIDYVFGTHPHDDHMGGMYDIITNFEIGKIIIPEVEDGEVTANWYIKLMTEIQYGEYNVEYAKEGTMYDFGDAIIKIIGPISKPNNNLNNYSTMLKVSFGEMDIIMTGDAETDVEEEVLAKYRDELDAEILKAGHHGSDTSTSDEFLEAVSPDYALISAKVGNKYEHPIKSVMDKFEEAEIDVYRTDENATVEVIITAKDATFSCEPGDYLSGVELEERENAQ